RTTYLTAPVERGDLVTAVTATGTLNAVVTVEVGSQLSGQIKDLLADFNDEVEKGQPIARLDPETYAARVREAEAALDVAEAGVLIGRAAVARAEADLAGAHAGLAGAAAEIQSAAATRADAARELARKQTLHARGTLADSDVERALAGHDSAAALLRAAEAGRAGREAAVLAAEAALRMAEADLRNARAVVRQRQAELDQAEVDLERTVIRAPIEGVVIGRDVDRGQTVAASLEAPTLFTLARDLREMEVHAKVDEADIGRIRPGQRVAFTVDAYPGRSFEGAVVQVRKAPQVVQNVVTYTVVASAANPDLLLLPGMTALVQIVVGRVAGVLKVPNAALRFRPPEGAAAAAGGGAAGPGAASGETGDLGRGTPAVVWVPRGDGGEAAPLAIGIGASDAAASEVVAGPLGEGRPVIVGTAADDDGGGSFLRFGF
ncbi:MAG TPA: efflux RND transporter periplasmic adaptor subunit, partial [Geminicoccaceae bacterium]|nr:efflux RND transporter periplasmic adaptor subunit [Geminicoccaceae bacterium]